MTDALPKILIVDDRRENLVALRKLLSRVEAETIAATSGNEALTQTLEHDFAMVLLDVQMPDMDGYEVAELLRGEAKTRAVPILFVTAAYKDDIHRLKGYHIGAVDYIEKPIIDTILLSKVGVFLQLYNRKQELEREIRVRQRAEHQLEAIDRFRAQFIAEPDPFLMFKSLQQDLLAMTDSKYGFIGEVLADAEGQRYIKTYSLSNLAWNDTTQRLYTEHRYRGFEFRNLDNLFGRAITSGVAIFSNNPADDPRGTGFPDGHPKLTSFLGLPVYYGKELVGEIGLANRIQGYDDEVIRYLAPVISVCGQIIVARQEHAARREAEAELSKLAKLDGLTGIPNRRHLDEHMAQEWLRGARSRIQLSLVMIDIDYFKDYNDSYGHLAGDHCLIQIAQLIQDAVTRPADIVGRYGGEEFLCVLPETDLDGTLKIARRISERLATLAIPHAKSKVTDVVTLSMGVATLLPSAHTTLKDAIALADQRLYEAKSSGRNRIAWQERNSHDD